MAHSVLTHRRALLVIVALLVVSCLVPARFSTRVGNVPRAALMLVLSPFTAPLKSLSDSLRPGRSLPLGVGSADQAQDRLGLALVVIDQLEQQLAAARQQIILLTHTDEIAMEGTRRIMARVTGFHDDRVGRVITIDHGTAKGVRDGAPVVHGVNLVGTVEKAYPTASDVKLITSEGTQFRVRIRSPRVDAQAGEVNEMIELSEDRSHFEVQLKVDAPVEVGDWAHLADSRWPPEAQGWVVGKVTQIKEDPENKFLFKRVIIHPMEPLSALSRVTVVVPVE